MEIENSMVVDWWWDEQEYGVPSKRRMKKEKQAYEEEEYGLFRGSAPSKGLGEYLQTCS